MTFVLISYSGTIAMALNYGYRRNRKVTTALRLATAALGATFVSMQAFEWTKLIHEGVRPWGNPWGAEQFGAPFFMITGFHGLHVSRSEERRVGKERVSPGRSRWSQYT